jgi:hypothetical protein
MPLIHGTLIDSTTNTADTTTNITNNTNNTSNTTRTTNTTCRTSIVWLLALPTNIRLWF